MGLLFLIHENYLFLCARNMVHEIVSIVIII